MPLVTFVILHYMTLGVTVRCIDSVLNKITYNNYKILVVDNGSENNTGRQLRNLYKNNSKVCVMCLECNKGFSSGNNAGYVYAKENLFSDYIIMINNDIEIIQSDFVQRAITCFEDTSYYVLGPDIINADGEHQNPSRNHFITKSEVRNFIVRQKIIRQYLKLHKRFNQSVPMFYIRLIETRKRKRKEKTVKDCIQTNISLFGACFIFSPRYLQESPYAFEELTFMYGEEELLSLRCKRNNWLILYNPSLRIFHAESVATAYSHNNCTLDIELFRVENMIKAMKAVYREYCKNYFR